MGQSDGDSRPGQEPLPLRAVPNRDYQSLSGRSGPSGKDEIKLLEMTGKAFYRCNLDGRIDVATTGFYQMMRFKDYVPGGQLIRSVCGGDKRWKSFLSMLLDHSGEIRDHTQEYWCQDGNVTPFYTNARYYYDRFGNVAGIEATIRAIE